MYAPAGSMFPVISHLNPSLVATCSGTQPCHDKRGDNRQRAPPRRLQLGGLARLPRGPNSHQGCQPHSLRFAGNDWTRGAGDLDVLIRALVVLPPLISRSHTLSALAEVASILVVAERPRLRPGTERRIVYGRSVQGRDLEAYRFGDGATTFIFIGGLHTGDEDNTRRLALTLLDLFRTAPELLPTNVSLYLIPSANPDGVAAGTYTNANKVDLNRNWPRGAAKLTWPIRTRDGVLPARAGNATEQHRASAAAAAPRANQARATDAGAFCCSARRTLGERDAGDAR